MAQLGVGLNDHNVKNIVISLVYQFGFSQDGGVDSIALELNKLIYSKVDFEKFDNFAESDPMRYALKRESAYAIYIGQINKIERQPVQYLKYIDAAIQKLELDKERLMYRYVATILPFDTDQYVISKQDLYKIIKHSLLEQNADILPERLDDARITIKRDYYKPFKLQTQEDIRKDSIKGRVN